MTTTDAPVVGDEGPREQIARIIDPVGWRIRGAHLLAANCDSPVDQWREKADSVVAGSLAKADAILSLSTPKTGGSHVE